MLRRREGLARSLRLLRPPQHPLESRIPLRSRIFRAPASNSGASQYGVIILRWCSKKRWHHGSSSPWWMTDLPADCSAS